MTPIELATLAAAVAQGLPAVVALLESLGCIITGCEEPLDTGPIPAAGDEMRRAQAEAHARVRGLDRGSIAARLAGDYDEVLRQAKAQQDAEDVYGTVESER